MPRKTLINWLLGVVVVVAAGCPGGEESVRQASENALPRASVTLRVAVVSDESLRRAIDRLRGEWSELTDGQIETIAIEADADLPSAGTDADLIIFPSRALGVLCEADALRPVRSVVLESEQLRFEDFLPLVRDHEITYAQQVMALPLGCPTPLLFTESDTGTSFQPSEDDRQLALAYLAWAAPHAVHRSRVATLFDSDTFKPRLVEPPFVRALENFVAKATGGPGEIIWPRREEAAKGELMPTQIPGAPEAYGAIAEEWETTQVGDQHATLVASSGRLVAVTKASNNAATAFRYAAWLAGPENTRQISTASNHVAICRGSMARAGDAWRLSDRQDLAKAFSTTEAEALRNSRFLFAPRLPGAEEYLLALGKQVRTAIDGTPAAEALLQAAVDWEAISHARDREKQRAAYERSLNAASFP